MARGPTFLILGSAKCGTTSLVHYLTQHPDVFITPLKEPIFFESEFDRGLDFYWKHYFADWSGERAVGEARTYNLYLPYVAERISQSYPEARLIAVLREPTMRAYSHWWHRYTRRLEKLSFRDAIQRNLELLEDGVRFEGEAGAREWSEAIFDRVSAGHITYVDLGYYAEQLRRYFAIFPRTQIKVLLFEDLASDPSGVARDLWEFLGVDPEVELRDLSPRNVALDIIERDSWDLFSKVYTGLGISRIVPDDWKAVWRKRLRGAPAQRPPIDPAMDDFLRRHFAERNRDLEQLLGRDLSAWRRRAA